MSDLIGLPDKGGSIVSPQNSAGLIRVGIWALPIAGLLSLVGGLVDLSIPDPGNDPTGAAQAASTTGYFLSQFVGNVLAVTLAIFGVLALFAYLVNTRGGRLATLGMVLNVLGLCLILSFLGVITYAIPALSQEYVNGQQDAFQMTDALFSGKLFTIIILSGLLQFVGFVLLGVAIWRSETLPKWAGALLGVAGLLLAVPADIPFLNVVASVLLVIAGVGIALSVLRGPSAPVGAEAQPRVR